MGRLATARAAVSFILANPVTVLRWAAQCAESQAWRAAAALASPSEWDRRMAPYRIRFEEFLERHHLEPGSPIRIMDSTPQVESVNGFELYVLATLCRSLPAARIMEIGTFRGRTTYNLAANLPEGGRVFTLNYVDANYEGKFVVGEAFRGTPLAARIEPLTGNSLHFDFRPWQGAIDLMFIDGNHSLEYVVQDSKSALRCVRPGGIIAWHDVAPDHFEVTQGMLETCQRYGVAPSLIAGTQVVLAVRPPELAAALD
jgi:predicted O-methyltransferase YrrM